MKVSTWNINSVRLRVEQVAQFVALAKPDVLCLQEIKCRDGEFPAKAFSDMGLRHVEVLGQKGWHGVAIVSKHKLDRMPDMALCPRNEARALAVRVKGVEVHNLYVPAGGEIPNRETNDKFAHKLDFLAAMRRYYAATPNATRLLVGDLNIAPGEHDVWSHKQLLDVVSHTPVETDALEAARTAGAFVDVARLHRPEPEKLFTWWSYRSPDWKANDRGRRLDHIWASPNIAPNTSKFTIDKETRSWDRPSDHVPISITLKV